MDFMEFDKVPKYFIPLASAVAFAEKYSFSKL